MRIAKGINTNQKGFTTVELAIVLIIFAMILSTVMMAFGLYTKQKQSTETDAAIQAVTLALLEYKGQYGSYPCPADPQIGPGNANYGREVRPVPWNNAAPTYLTTDCSANPNIADVASIDVDNNPATPDRVLIGAVPWSTLLDPDGNPASNDGVIDAKLAENLSVDAWGNKLTYAVTKRETRSDTYNDFIGAIDFRDENNFSVMDVEDQNFDGVLQPGEDLNGNGVIDPGRYAQIALVSHGPDGLGAYTRGGKLVQPCVNGVAIPGGQPTLLRETTNCNGDAIFLQGLKNDVPHYYNDDTVAVISSQDSSLWIPITNTQIKNVNSGNVGVGTTNPREKLHVNGALFATRVWARQYEDATGGFAMTSDVLAGDGAAGASAAMQCALGKVVSSIDKNKANCIAGFKLPTAITPCPNPGDPPSYKYMHGVTSDAAGNVTPICCDPTIAGSCN